MYELEIRKNSKVMTGEGVFLGRFYTGFSFAILGEL